MTVDERSAMTQLSKLTECCICLKTYTDPRMLPCIHTLCFQCLQDMAAESNKKPGDEIQCPICRKEFTLPKEGVQGIQKNFFMASFIEVRNALNQPKMTLPCDICKAKNDGTDAKISQATMRCLVCEENFCEGCCKMHKSFKMLQNHEIQQIGSEAGEEVKVKSLQVMNCDIHHGKLLDHYCTDCKKFVCVCCVVESHGTHECTDVNTVEEEFRQSIKRKLCIMVMLAEELSAKRKKMERKEEFLKKIATRESEILQQSKVLKDMIDEHTKSLLSSLDEVKNRHLKEIQVGEEELDRRFIILESFISYCDELGSKGSVSEICQIIDELQRRACELERDHEMYIMRPHVSFDVTFQATEFEKLLNTTNGNIIGSVNENVEQLQDICLVIGGDGDMYKINLCPSVDTVSHIGHLPTAFRRFPTASVYNNTMFIVGIGNTGNEIWKYNFASGWKRCGSLIQGREKHCSEFLDETLYICGGGWEAVVMDSIEAYNALTEKSSTVGKLIVGSQNAACVVYEGSIYVFGGSDKGHDLLDCVQVYNPVNKTCTLLASPLPCPSANMQAVLWRTYAILLGFDNCFIFDFESKIWRQRNQFATSVILFGMVLGNDRVFSIGGAFAEDDDVLPMFIDDVLCYRASSIIYNEEGIWQTHCPLPKPIHVLACAKLTLLK